MQEFKLPDLGEGVTEAEIDKWLVSEGDVIEEDAPLVDVITDKATAEIPSPYAGTVARIHVDAGATVPVGTVLVTITAEGESAPTAQAETKVAAAAGSGGPPPPPPAEVTAAPTVGTTPVVESAPPVGGNGSGRVKAMPPVRKLARELGVDLGRVRGSGPGGRVLRTDVEAFAGGGQAAQARPAAGERREAFRGIRRRIAERMAEAHRTIPPVTHVEECDVTELDATRKLANERSPEAPKLTYLPFIVKAVVAGLKEFPALNTTLDEDAGEIVFHNRYDIGVAVDTPGGLVVPVVKGADARSMRDLAGEIRRLAGAATEGTITAEELRGGTFTVTSPGPFGGLMATPIILHPQTAILGVHRAVERPVVRDGQIVVRKIMNLSITFDHRVMDGVTAAKFCMEVGRLLEHPALLALDL